MQVCNELWYHAIKVFACVSAGITEVRNTMRALTYAVAPLAAGLLFAAGQAQAITIVLGGGLAAECYSTAENADPNEAFETCSRALRDPDASVRDRAATYINRSVVRLRVRDYAGAISDADQAIQRWPSLSEAYVNRGAALINLNRPRDALRELDQAIDRGLDKLHLAYYNRAMAKEMVQDVRGAYGDLRKVVELEPNYTLATEQLKRFQIVNGQMMMMPR
jgi:tetratricopeptide (TPR) repeat protein